MLGLCPSVRLIPILGWTRLHLFFGGSSESCHPDLPEIGIEALSVNRIRRSGRFAELFEGRDAAEHRHAVDPQDLAVRRLRQLDSLAVGLETRGFDPAGRDGPEDVGVAGTGGTVRRLGLLLAA